VVRILEWLDKSERHGGGHYHNTKMTSQPRHDDVIITNGYTSRDTRSHHVTTGVTLALGLLFARGRQC